MYSKVSMNVLIIIYLAVFGLIFGSFINAIVWRLHQQLDDDGNPKKLSAKKRRELSISKGRSMCPSCKHQLATKDLVPVISWLSLKGKCRYCKKPISAQYPIVELFTTVLFVTSYVFWPYAVAGAEWFVFVGYLLTLVCLIAMAIYDLKWFILPSKLIYIGIAVYSVGLIAYAVASGDYARLWFAVSGAAIFFVLFFSIFMASYVANNKGWSSKDWLGFGDVRLAFLLGLLVGSPGGVFVAMFMASIFGIIFALPGMIDKKLTVTSQIPFGPFLITGAILTLWWGADLINWYTNILTPY